MTLTNCPFCNKELELTENSYSCGDTDLDHEFFYVIDNDYWYLDSKFKVR